MVNTVVIPQFHPDIFLLGSGPKLKTTTHVTKNKMKLLSDTLEILGQLPEHVVTS